jgi:hypothetical protein
MNRLLVASLSLLALSFAFHVGYRAASAGGVMPPRLMIAGADLGSNGSTWVVLAEDGRYWTCGNPPGGIWYFDGMIEPGVRFVDVGGVGNGSSSQFLALAEDGRYWVKDGASWNFGGTIEGTTGLDPQLAPATWGQIKAAGK